MSIIIGIVVCLASVHCTVADRRAKFLVQGNSYWISAVGIVFGRSKCHLSNDNVDFLIVCRLCELYAGCVSLMTLSYIVNLDVRIGLMREKQSVTGMSMPTP